MSEEQILAAQSHAKTVLVTGANGYIGNAVAKAFRGAGWKTYGLIRRSESARDLALHEIRPVLGSTDNPAFLEQAGDAVFDVIVSNTEDYKDPTAHFANVRQMLDVIAKHSQKHGKRLLAMFTSGCKDYGPMLEGKGDTDLACHTEVSPMHPPAFLAPRMEFGESLLRSKQSAYDATILRPTIVYGRSSSLYGKLFDLAAGSGPFLELKAHPNAIMHSLHVDDCAEAYVSLAEHPERAAVAQQAFNIANTQYETAQEVGEALAKSYGQRLRFVPPPSAIAVSDVNYLANFSQWVDSGKIRRLTEWKEKRQAFVAGIEDYRLAHTAWSELGK